MNRKIKLLSTCHYTLIRTVLSILIILLSNPDANSQNFLSKNDTAYAVIKGTNTIYIYTAEYPKEFLINATSVKGYNLEIKDELWRTPNNINLGTTGYKIGLYGSLMKRDTGYWVTIKGMIKEGVAPGKEIVCENPDGIPMVQAFEHIMGVAETLKGTIFSFGDPADGYLYIKPNFGK